MKILVCIKQVPASNKVEVDPITGVMKRSGTASKMNPYDLFALEAAFRIREKQGGTVTVLTMGPNQAESVIREAFAMGADDGYILSDRKFAGADVLATSYTLAKGIGKIGEFDLILCGEQTTDGDTAQVGMEVSERLHLPAAAGVFAFREIERDFLTVDMDLGDSVQTVTISLPCLICVKRDLFTPRLPSYKRMKDTASRPVGILSFPDLDGAEEDRVGLAGSPTQVKRVFPPEKRGETKVVAGSAEDAACAIFDELKESKFI